MGRRKFSIILTALLVLMAAAVPLFQAQELGSSVRVLAVPQGAFVGVDGIYSKYPMTVMWAKGSKHLLSVDSIVQSNLEGTQFVFGGWEYNGGSLPGGNLITVTADPLISEYRALFSVNYPLTVAFFDCPDSRNCQSPGTVYVNREPIRSDKVLYLSAGSNVQLVAQPNDGYIFAGWEPGQYQKIEGFINTLSLNGPSVVYPRFIKARRINLGTVPEGLFLLADRGQIPTPANLDWGYETTHTVGALTPQQDRFGAWWAFSSWSDGGAATHAYKVGPSNTPETITAKYVPVAVTQISTQPVGLSINVDGRDTWPSYNFPWGIGETHRLDAPMQQTDAQGRLWKFKSWSTGSAAAHTFTVPEATGGAGFRLVATYDPVARVVVKSTQLGLRIQVDGADCVTPCDVQRAIGSTIRIAAPARIPLGENVRGDFNGWPGSGSTAPEWSATLGHDPITLTADYRVMNRLSAAADPPNGVSWRLDPASPDGYYDTQTAVSVKVTPLAGYRFRGWSGDITGANPAAMVAMTTPRSVLALLDRVPYIAPAGVSNAAGSLAQPGVAPGSVISVFGVHLAPALEVGPENPLAQTLGGVTVRAGDRFLPLFFVSSGQINMQLPPDLAEGNQMLTISTPGSPDVRAPFLVVRNAPGLFASDSLAVAIHEDGSPVTPDAPAQRGELITLYGTGLGPTDRPRLAGFPVPPAPQFLIADQVTVQLGDASLAASGAYAMAGRIGVDAVQFRAGDDIPSGNVALRISVNSRESNQVLLPVR